MGDIKVFRIDGAHASELLGHSVDIEKSLQVRMERHLDTFLGVTFLASEYLTGKTHSGRIDSIGIDENYSPVIIEYKRSINENVINQGLFYLDWLLDHRAEFTLMAMEKLGPESKKKIDWDGTRLICVAHDFTKYDEHAVSQINRNIELIRYRLFGDELILLELVNAKVAAPAANAGIGGDGKKATYKTVTEYLKDAPPDLLDLFEGLKAYVQALGDDIQMSATQQYFAFRRIKNFACVEVHPKSKKLLLFVKVDPDSVVLQPGFTRDVRKIGHFGTGDLEITIDTPDDLVAAKPLVLKSYEAS